MTRDEIRSRIRSQNGEIRTPWVNADAMEPAPPQCWKCDSFRVDTVPMPGELQRECLDCGTEWKDKNHPDACDRPKPRAKRGT